jgi:hypothetical protein
MITTNRGSRRSRYPVLFLAIVSLTFWSLAFLHAGGPLVDGVTLGGQTTASPVSLLGTYADLGDCTQAPLKVGSAKAVFCDDWGGVVSASGEVEVVTLHALNDSSVVDAYTGALPKELVWGDSIADVRAKLGEPNRITSIYGTPTFVYMYRGDSFGSLELRFSAGDRLMGINACLMR